MKLLVFFTLSLLLSCGPSDYDKINSFIPAVEVDTVHPADTATNCDIKPRDVHGYINRKWFWIGIEEGKRSEVRCFKIDTSGYSDPKATTGNWVIYNEGSMDVGGPGKWSRCSYAVDGSKTMFRMYDFKNFPKDNDTLAFEILRLDDDFLIVYDADTSMTQQSHLYMRRK